MLGKGYEDP
jgi:hypothetical protein